MSENYEEQLEAILAGSQLPKEQKEKILLQAIQTLAPVAIDAANRSADGKSIEILMQLLVQFLPILLKILSGI